MKWKKPSGTHLGVATREDQDMKTMSLVILTLSMAACGDSMFRSRPESSNLKIGPDTD